ncbi:MAG: acyltransferase family protein [Syntrophaceae bacterium]|nr:acyltransferase family protein [Syntrophaceae bacterium]
MNIPHQRNLYIDIAKAIGISIVVFAHNMENYTIRSYLFPFAVHFFFFIAGYNFNLSKYREYPVNFIRTRFLRLMLPYLTAVICSYFIYLAVAPILSLPPITTGAFVDGLTSGYIHDLEFNIVLWFLPALFFVDIIFLALGYKLQGFYFLIAIMLVTAAGFILGRDDRQLILSLDIAMTVQLFVYVGYIFRKYNLLEKAIQSARSSRRNFFLIALIILTLIIIMVYSANQALPDIPTRIYGQPLLFFIAGICGSTFILMTSLVIDTVVHRYAGKILATIGQASLDILISHIPISFFIAAICTLLWDLWIYHTVTKYWYLIFLISVALPTLTHTFIASILNKTIAKKHRFF